MRSRRFQHISYAWPREHCTTQQARITGMGVEQRCRAHLQVVADAHRLDAGLRIKEEQGHATQICHVALVAIVSSAPRHTCVHTGCCLIANLLLDIEKRAMTCIMDSSEGLGRCDDIPGLSDGCRCVNTMLCSSLLLLGLTSILLDELRAMPGQRLWPNLHRPVELLWTR
jgi:hypothetical protein